MESDALESRGVRRSSLGFRRVFQGEGTACTKVEGQGGTLQTPIAGVEAGGEGGDDNEADR